VLQNFGGFYAAHYRELGLTFSGYHLIQIRSHSNAFDLAAFAFSLITLPVWAAHTDSLSWVAIEPTAIGSAHVMPGNYQLRAEEGKSELQVIHDGKVIATVPCHWT
jgi:hypothetical protein